MTKHKKRNVSKPVYLALRDVFSILKNPFVIAIATGLAAIFALVFAFTAHGLFLLDVLAGIALKAIIIHKAVKVTKHKRVTRRQKLSPIVEKELA